MGYDADSELEAVTLTNGTNGFDNLTTNQAVTYGYDAAGNRTVERTPKFLHTFGTNNLNQLTNITPKPIHVQGSTDSVAATILVNGQGVTENASNQFEADITPVPGTSTPLTIQATKVNGTTTTQKNHVLNTTPFLYDANGNLIQDAHEKYIWDAQDRLVQINYLENVPSAMADNIKMSYDGIGHRVSIVESHGSTVLTTKTFVWVKDDLCEERDGTGNTVKKRFYNEGEQVNGSNYYFTFDEMQSIREMTDSNGSLHASYDYSPYGRQSKLLGDLDSDFGFTGFYIERTACLDFTHYRVYDSEKGIWLSRDPLAEVASLNLYEYVRNCPLDFVDSLGLMGVWIPGKNAPYPGFNWCGPGNNKLFGMDLPPVTLLDSCCKTHDACYDAAGVSASNNMGGPPLTSKQKCDMANCDQALCNCSIAVLPVTTFVNGIYYTIWNVVITGWSCIYQPKHNPRPKCPPCK